MKLKEYMERQRLTAAEVAEAMSYSLSAVRKWMQGVRAPKHETKKRLHRWTRGKVSFDDWN